MSKTFLDGFGVGDKHFRHFINTSDDSTTIEDQDENVLFRVNSSAYVFDRKEGWVGNFYMNDKHEWYFKDAHSDLKINYGNWDLLAAERAWAKAQIEKETSDGH